MAYSLFYTDYYSKDKSLRTLDESRLRDFSEKIDGFDDGRITASELADAMIHALFNRDFDGSGNHWSGDGTRISPIRPPIGGTEVEGWRQEILALGFTDPDSVEAFKCEESSTWDWKDIYSVATSSSTIVISRTEKRIVAMNYKFNCTG